MNATTGLLSKVTTLLGQLAERASSAVLPEKTPAAIVTIQSHLSDFSEAHLPRLDTILSQARDIISEQRAELTHNFSNWLVTYGPFLPIIFFLWPIILSVILTVLSASTWTFWLLTSVIVGIVQVIYVTYTFAMISFDLAVLSMLKAFALVRSQIRYFTVKSGLQTKGSKRRARRRGRRREWRKKVEAAGNYEEYTKIEIDEPEQKFEQQQEVSWIKRLFSGRTRTSAEDSHEWRGTVTSSIAKSRSCVNLDSPQKVLLRQQSDNQGEFESGTVNNSGTSPMSRVNSMHNMQLHRSASHEVVEAELGMTGAMLLTTTARLREARLHANSPPSSPRRPRGRRHLSGVNDSKERDGGDEDGDAANGKDNNDSSLKFLLAGVVKRNHLSVDDMLREDARSVAESGRHHISQPARETIKNYNEEVEKSLDWIAEAPIKKVVAAAPSKRQIGDDASLVMERQGEELSDRIHLLRKLKQNMGRTALMLSGGGAQAMYHLGTVRALIESGAYGQIKVVSGTSGGSISAAMCAIKTSEELHRDVCVDTVSTDYLLNGKMKKGNIRWFPTPVDMASYWLKTRLMVDSKEFKRCCDFYYGDITFEEAYERTQKHVCITVSASRASAGSGGGAQRLLLNHISTPHVTIASAVAASCALPGVMKPAKLLTKNSSGMQEPFEVDGVEWIDGSVQADLPFKRISTLFNVSNYIVCQTNFHVVPFLNKAHHPNVRSLYWRTFQTCEWDIRNRVLNLSRLGLFPKFFGQDVSKVFKQKYHGDLTLVPKFTTMQVFGMKALSNPTVEDMKVYLKNGQAAAWPYLTVIKDMIRLEAKIDGCIARLEERYHALAPEYDALRRWNDDADSISISSTVSVANRMRMASAGRETELLRQKVHTLERENVSLRRQVGQLQRALGIVNPPTSPGVGGKNMLDAPLIGGVLSFTLNEDGEEEELSAAADAGGDDEMKS